MNIAFTRIIRIDNRQYEFNFRKLPGASFAFHADVTDDRQHRHMFTMDKLDGNWKADGVNLPSWIVSNEQAIGEVIEEAVPEVQRN